MRGRPMNTKNVRYRMREERLKRGLSIEKLADEVHYSKVAIQQAESGKRYAGKNRSVTRDAFWDALSEYFNTPKEELMKIGDWNNDTLSRT